MNIFTNLIIHEHGILAFRLLNEFDDSFFVGCNLFDQTRLNGDHRFEHVALSSADSIYKDTKILNRRTFEKHNFMNTIDTRL